MSGALAARRPWLIAILGASLFLALFSGPARAAPTVTTTDVDAMTSGTGYCAYGTFGSHNQRIVTNGHGIFMSYLHADDCSAGLNASTWRLARSTDNGATWSTLYSLSCANANAATLETDGSDNVYAFIGSCSSWSGNWSSSPTTFLKFGASNSYASPLVTNTTVIPVSSSKFTSAIDLSRSYLYFLTWWNGSTTNQLYVIDFSGTLVRSVLLWGTATTSGAAVEPTYPHLHVGSNGNLYAAWTNTDFSAPGQDYYDAKFIYSTDAGATWQGPPGAITLPINPGPLDTNSWEIVDSGDIKSIGTTADNWLSSLAYDRGFLHFVYDVNFGSKEVYKRFNFSSGTFDTEVTPSIHGKTITIGQAHGAFSQDSTGTGRLFYGSDANGSLFGHVGILYTDDAGETWHDYASSSNLSVSNELYLGYNAGGRLLDSSGAVLGALTRNTSDGNPADVFFWRATPDSTTLPTPLLNTTLDSSTAISSPVAGTGTGSSTNGTFVTGHSNNGLSIAASSAKYARFQETDGTVNNVNLAKGTVEFWYKPSYANTDNAEHQITGIGALGTAGSVSFKKGGAALSNALVLNVIDNSTVSHMTKVATTAYSWSANTWHEIRFTWDSTVGTGVQNSRIYIDGNEVSAYSQTATGGFTMPAVSSTKYVYVGNISTTETNSAAGVLDDYMIYGAVVTP
jgi:hypothetical protein